MKEKASKLNLILFPFVFIIAFSVSAIETYKYSGFFLKHFRIDSLVFYFASAASFLCLAFSVSLLKRLRHSKLFQLFFGVGMVGFVLTLLAYLIFSGLEIIFYKNLVFSKFHIQTSNLVFDLLLLFETAYLYFATNERFRKLKTSAIKIAKSGISYLRKAVIKPLLMDIRKTWSGRVVRLKYINLAMTMAVLMLSGFGIYNLFTCLHDSTVGDLYILSHLNANYDKKMEDEWGILYRLVELIKYHTPDSAKILLPPWIAPWSVVGNINQIRYFLGDRTLVNAADVRTISGDPDYILIAKGGLHVIYDVVKSDDEYGWPKTFVPAKTIWYVDKATGKVTEVHKDFDPSDPFNKTAWGLIQVDKSRFKN